MKALVREIVACRQARSGINRDVLITYLTGRLNKPLAKAHVEPALRWLESRRLVRIEGEFVRLSEPDRPELQLYSSLSQHFSAEAFLGLLSVEQRTYVFQDTSTGGRRGHGPLSKPDFTLAVVKSVRFARPIEVTTFEVKNRSGVSDRAVFEITGHGRFSHFPFLACPNSNLEASKIDGIRRACEQTRIGLILFDIVEDGDGHFTTDNVRIDMKPERRSPDMSEVQNYLEGRLSPDNCAKLENLARGA